MSDTPLIHYGRQLTEAGFKVWHTPFGRDGYLTYQSPEGYWGTLQDSWSEGWQHLMPLVPSVTFGSSMHLDTDLDPFTVEAARECARAFNRNDVIGRQANAGSAYLSPTSVEL